MYKSNKGASGKQGQSPKANHAKRAEGQLRAERENILAKLAVSPSSPDELADGWQERDSSSERDIRDVEYALRESLRQRLLQVDQALERLRAGTYGLCTQCAAKISRKRLDKEPAATLCLPCQTATEGPL